MDVGTVALNPHWFKEPAVQYRYRDNFQRIALINSVGIALWPIAKPFMGPLWYAGLILIPILVFLPASLVLHSERRIDIRYDFLTEYRGDTPVFHEDMRGILSIAPVFSRKNRLRFHLITFENGKTLQIYSDLLAHDELIGKLNTYL